MIIRRTGILCVLLSAIAGCAGMTNQLIPPPPPPQGSTVGAVSLIGPNFRLTHVGFTVFENGEAWCSTAPFDPDDYARQVVKRNVETMGFRYVELKYTPYDFQNAYDSPEGWVHGLGITHMTGELRDILAKTPATRVVFLRRWKWGDGANATIGLGVMHRSFMGVDARGAAHATLIFNPVDGKTLDVLASYTNPWAVPIDESLWPGAADCSKITAEQRDRLTAKFKQALDLEITYLLSRAGMAPASPAQ